VASRRRFLPAALALTLCATLAHADPSAADKQRARALMDRGDLLFEAKSYEEALDAYERADQIMHVPTTGIEVARAHAALGHFARARAVALEVARSPKTPGEPAVFDEARAEAAKLAGELADKVEPAPPSAPVAPAPAPAPEPSDARYEPMIVGGFVTAGAGVMLGTLFGVMSLARASSAKDLCAGNRCPPQARDDIEASKTLGILSDVGFVIALAGAAVGGYGLWAQSREVRPVVGLGTIGVEGRF
jgi:tetratricopeptide (TPR) repeat protein